jgi:hypothetical protein
MFSYYRINILLVLFYQIQIFKVLFVIKSIPSHSPRFMNRQVFNYKILNIPDNDRKVLQSMTCFFRVKSFLNHYLTSLYKTV